MRMATYHLKVAKYYNAQVKAKEFIVEDLVLRQANVSQPTKQRKLSSTGRAQTRWMK